MSSIMDIICTLHITVMIISQVYYKLSTRGIEDQAWGVGSIDKTFAIQVWQPELGSQNPCESQVQL